MNGNDNFRDFLSSRLVKWSAVGLIILAGLVMVGATVAESRSTDGGGQVLQAAQLLFSALLPLFGTWVGTILAYYYSKENFEAASRGTIDVVRNVVQRLQAAPVLQNMMARSKIVTITVPAGKTLGDLAIAEVERQFGSTGANGQRVSRLLVTDGGDACIGVIHRSTFIEMLADGLRAQPAANPATDVMATLLKQSYPAPIAATYGEFIEKTVAYIAQDRTVADAKAAMEQLRGCQDVVVTRTGSRSDPMLGWISNVDISRLSQA